MGRNLVRIAHRGASRQAPENTLAAFAQTLAIGVDAVELDVHATSDRQVVVIHDSTLDRTTDATGKVSDLALDQVRRADAGVRFGAEFAGEPVPTLRESLELIAGTAIVVVEIKPSGIAEEVVQVIEDAGAVDRVVVISFKAANIRDVRAINPQIPTSLLIDADATADGYAQGLEYVRITTELGAGTLSLSHKTVTPELSRAVRERGIALWTWTVDEVDQMRALLDCGVTAITSNCPDLFKELA